MYKKDKIFWLTYLYLLVLVLIRLIPIITPGSRSWGFNHLIFLPDIYSYVFFTITAVALVFPFLKLSEKAGKRLAEWFSDKFLDGRRRYYYRLTFIAVMTSLFAVFAAPTHFLGDGYDVIQNIASQSGAHIKWSEIVITKLMVFITSLFSSDNMNGSLLSFKIVSIFSGAVVLYFMILISQILSENNLKRLIVFMTILFSGALLLFFGYAEYYPIIWVFITGFIYFGVKFLKRGVGLIFAWLFLIIGIVLHVQMTVFIPAALYISFAKGNGLIIYGRFRKLIWSLISFLFISGLYVLINKYTTNLYVEDMFLPLFNGKPVNPEYAILSVPHLLDIVNEFILVSPLLFLLLVLGIRNIKKNIKNKTATFFWLGAICSILFLFVIDPKLAFPRDWDLFSMSGFSFLLLSAVLIGRDQIQYIGKFILTFTMILSIYSLPYLLVNLNTDRSEKYFENLIALDESKSMSSMTVLSRYYQDNNQKEKYEVLMAKFNDNFLQERLISSAMDACLAGDMKSARKYNQLIRPDKFNGDYQRFMAVFNYGSGRFEKALDHINKAIQLRKYASDYYWTRSRIYYSMKKYDLALSSLRESHNLVPSSLKAIDAMTMLYDLINRPDSCVYYAKKTLELDSTRFPPYKYIIKWLARAGKMDMAQRYKALYSKFVPNDSAKMKNLELLDSIIINKGR